MATVYSEKQAGLRIIVENVSENENESGAELSAASTPCDKDSGEKSGAGRAVGAGSPAQEAQEHAELHHIRIKEEPVEEEEEEEEGEGEFVTVHVDGVGEDNWESGRGAHFSGRDDNWPFGSKGAYMEHRREHTHDGPIVCLDTDSKWDNLLVSTDGGRQTWCCALCGCSFSNSREFFTHQLKHRNEIIKQESLLEPGEGLAKPKIFECKDCGKAYSSIGQCLNHQRSHKQASKSVFHQLAHLKKKSFQCPTCGRSYSRASALDAHRRCHEEKLFKKRNSDGEKQPSDEVTVKTEDTADTSSEQLDESPKKLFDCVDCGKSFRTMCGLGTHQRFSVNCSGTTVKVRAKRSFECTECGKTFHRAMAMQCHQRWHKRREQVNSKEQPFKCKECGKVFTSLTFLSKHQQRAHSNELPAKSFLHQVFQLQKKAFECQECGCRFSRASALHSHQLCHTDVFGDILEGGSQKSSAEQTVVSNQNQQDKAAHFGGATAHTQNMMQTNIVVKELRRDEPSGTEDHDAKDDLIPVIVAVSGSHGRGHVSQQNPDLELVCESDQEEKDVSLTSCKEYAHASQPVDSDNDVNIVQIDCVNFNEGSENAEMEQNPSQEAKYECSECNRTFDKAISLRGHMLMHRGGLRKNSRYQRKNHITSPVRKVSLICEICGHESLTKASHYLHLGKHEDRKPYKSITYQLANLQKNGFKCDVCGMHFSRLSALQSHQQHHNNSKKPYACLQCHKSYSNASTLNSHRKVCTGKESLTTNSHSDEDRKAEQFDPSKTLLGPKVHHCEKCGKGFWSMGAFIHHKQYNPQCADVNASSSGDTGKPEKRPKRKKRGNKKVMKSNTPNRKPRIMPERVKSKLYKCDVCDKSYRVIGCFLKHKLIHQNQGVIPLVKPFDQQVEELQKSMHTCPDCGQNFTRAMALQFHMKSHGYETGLPVENTLDNKPDRPQCPICRCVFICESSLEIHQKHCIKAKGQQVEIGQEKAPDNPSAPKEDDDEKHAQEGMKDVSEEMLEIPSGTSDLKHQCDDCGEIFSVLDALNVHKKTHCTAPVSMESQSVSVNVSSSTPEESTSVGLFYCTECGRKFSTNSALGTHRRWHKDKKLARFIIKGNKMSRKTMENGPFLCNLCGKGFFYLCVLRRHQKYHPPIVAQPDPEQNLKITEHLSSDNSPRMLDCPDCDAFFNRGTLLAAHFATHHAKPSEVAANPDEREPPSKVQASGQSAAAPPANRSTRGDKPKIKYFCVPCNKRFINARGLRAHKWQKHRRGRGRPYDTKPYSCLWCERCYGSNGALQKHQKTCNETNGSLKQPYKPDVAEEQPPRPLEFGAKCLFKCSNCGKAFPSEKQLESHKEAARARPYSCTLCCRGYWTEAQLQQHLIWHDEVRRRLPTELRYRLNSSGVSSRLQVLSSPPASPQAKLPSTAANLQVERMYKCYQCSKTFVSPHALQEHRARNKCEEPYHCSLCPKTFVDIQDLIDHHQECLGDKEFQGTPSSVDTESLTCIECGVSFSQETDLHQHYIDHARGEF